MTLEAAMRDMNPIPEPDELREAECNAQGLYGLPEAFAAAGDTGSPAAGGWSAPAPMQASRDEEGRDALFWRARPLR